MSEGGFLRQPLFHFVLLGLALFALYVLTMPAQGSEDDQIVVSAQRIETLASLWQRQWRRPPTEQELDGLIDSYIREEVLYRQAKAMGLDRDDTVIRRRLAQKLELISQDLATQGEPGTEELQKFYDEHPEIFEDPAEITFRHVYVNRDNRGDGAVTEAERLLAELRAGADPRELGDRFMLQRYYVNVDESQAARNFGSGFGAAVFALEPGEWHGPVPSGYGLHLVRVEDRREARRPDLDEVREKVKNEFQSYRRREMTEAFYERLLEDYEVIIERPAVEAEATAAGGST